MAYATVEDIKEYLGLDGNEDYTLISNLLDRATQYIDDYTRTSFAVDTDTSHYYDVNEDTDGQTLWLREPLASITTVQSNADATTPTTLTTAQYVTIPRNKTPYYGLKILGSSTLYWNYTNDPEAGIKITGKFGYSTSAPADIKHACIRLASYYYRQKDSQVFDVTAIPEAGVITAPIGVPSDVRKILDEYQERIHT